MKKIYSDDEEDLFGTMFQNDASDWIEKLWKEDQEKETKQSSELLFLRPWKTTSALMFTFDEFNENVLHKCHREHKTLKEKIGSLCLDGTITVFPSIGVYINRALYMGQPIGDLFPMGHYGDSLWTEDRDTDTSVKTRENYLCLYNKKSRKECVCHKDVDIHYSSYLTFSNDIYECNLAVLDDLTLIVLMNIFHGAAKPDKEISFVNPVKAVCYLGNWIIK